MKFDPSSPSSGFTPHASGWRNFRDVGNSPPWRFLLALTGLGLAFRLFRIGHKGMWLDETFSVWLGWHALPEMISWIIRIDQHPPLYYTLLHFWLKLGDSAGMARTLSALAGVLTIPVFYWLGQQLLGPRVGLLAAFILTISPFNIRFAQETRMYTLLTLNAALAMLALVHLLAGPEAKRRRLAWLGYILFTTATMLTHNTALFFPVATNLFVFGLILWRWWGPQQSGPPYAPPLKQWLVAQLGVLLLWSPWLPPFIIQATGVYREFWISAPSLGTVIGAITNLLSVYLPEQVPRQFEWTDGVWLGFGFLIALGCYHLRRQPAALLLLLSLFLTPFVGEWLVSLRRPIFYDRTLIWTALPLYLLLAAGLAQLRYRPLILAALLAVVAINTISLKTYYYRVNKEEWGQAAAYVAAQARPDDLLLFNATWVQIPFDFYFRHFDRQVTKHGVPVDLFDRGVLEPKMTPADLPRLHDLVRSQDRVWLIYSHAWYTDPNGLIPAALAEEFRLLERQRFIGIEVMLYERAP